MDQYMRETECKSANDTYHQNGAVWVPTALIVGAGPSGLATAACLKSKGVPSLILERSDSIASLWRMKTYDRLKLHLPKNFCELPLMEFPRDYPTYPTRRQFVEYLEEYVAKFDLRPIFNETVVGAGYDEGKGVWRVETEAGREYVCRWLVVATGENAEAVVPEIEGAEEFGGEVVHSSVYRSGEGYFGKRVVVVGCGNSGMEVALDLCNFNATPSLAVRDTVHVLPQEMLGISTFGLSVFLMKWFPVSLVDRFLLATSWLLIGDTGRLGLNRPKLGPLELKTLTGKTPVLDVGTLDKIKSGYITVRPGIRRIRPQSVEFVDGTVEEFDAIILATGYKSNVPYWLKENEMFCGKDGLPKKAFPNGWKGENGLYSVGFTKRGLLGASIDARNVADDIESCLRAEESNHLSAVYWPYSFAKKHMD